jgi:hypothetical protein
MRVSVIGIETTIKGLDPLFSATLEASLETTAYTKTHKLASNPKVAALTL